MDEITIFWFRRDIRLSDNKGLYYALKNNSAVLPVFIFDTNILHLFNDRKDKRVQFIYDELLNLKKKIEEEAHSSLIIKYGTPEEVFRELFAAYNVTSLYFNNDYEPYAIERDKRIRALAKEHNISVYSFKDHVIFETNEVTKDDGKPYTVYTPYMRKWKSQLATENLTFYPVEEFFSSFKSVAPFQAPAIDDLGFEHVFFRPPPREIPHSVIKQYEELRDFPFEDNTSKLGIHLRFGTISIRQVVEQALFLNEVWLKQLIWREFFMMILWNFPRVVSQSFKPEYDRIEWVNNEEDFARWCEGKTGYPMVDAGMRQLNQTGYMHNRLRMVTASFLTKHLLIDWRWGEAYFAQKLNDYELASNNGGWQWAAGTGCDAVPYFRVFSPERQEKRFDPGKKYIKKWVKEYGTDQYPAPVIQHKYARERALDVYKNALNS